MTPTRDPDRLALILERRVAGWTLQRIGDHLGLTRERVRQLLLIARQEPTDG